VIGDIPVDYHNCVVHADLAPDEADGMIQEIPGALPGARGSWRVGPSMRPADIGERLVRHGFSYSDDDTGMAVDLAALPEEAPVSAELEIQRVRSEETF
jgi:hypothetical protein